MVGDRHLGVEPACADGTASMPTGPWPTWVRRFNHPPV